MPEEPISSIADFLRLANGIIAYERAQGIVPSPQTARAKFKGFRQFSTDAPPTALVRDATAPGPRGNRVPLRLYHPRPDTRLPVVLSLHGGGHMCGDLDLYDPISRQIAGRAGCVVVAVDYALAPEHPWPQGQDDCWAVLAGIDQLFDDRAPADTGRLFVAGDSAGGNLAAWMAILAARRGAPKLAGQVLIYPSLDFTCSLPSHQRLGSGYFLEETRIRWYYDHYFTIGADRRAASPLFVEDLAGLPPALILTAELDPLRDEAIEYARRLRAAGVPITHRDFAGMIHAFLNLQTIAPRPASDAYASIASFISDPLAPMACPRRSSTPVDPGSSR